MELPYSIEVYLALLDSFNRSNLTFVAAGLLVCLVAAMSAHVSLLRGNVTAKRLILAGLAACSVFVAIVHQHQMMADFNFMAPIYAGLWLLQAAILIWLASTFHAIRLFSAASSLQLVGTAVAAYGILLHPILLALTQESSGFGVPLAGSSPNPTILVIAGVLLTMKNPPIIVFLVPLAWGMVSAMTAYLLQVPVDYAVAISVLILVAVAFRKPASITH